MSRIHQSAIGLLLCALAFAACTDDDDEAPQTGSDGSGGVAGSPNIPRSSGGSAGDSVAGGTAQAGTAGTAGGFAGDAGAASGGLANGGSSAGTAGSGGSVGSDAPLALPFAVDEHYVPSGGMGDASVKGPVDHAPDLDCKPRPENVVGRCWKATYNPADQGWAGFYWQYPVNNWGEQPGREIAAGAVSVSFYAASNIEGLKVQFLVGGINDPTQPSHDPNLYFDPYVEKYIPPEGLTTELTRYTIPLPPTTAPVTIIGAFGWTIGSMDPGQATIPPGQAIELYLDGIQWE